MCGGAIAKGETRLGRPEVKRGKPVTGWSHVGCVAPAALPQRRDEWESVQGWDALGDGAREALLRASDGTAPPPPPPPPTLTDEEAQLQQAIALSLAAAPATGGAGASSEAPIDLDDDDDDDATATAVKKRARSDESPRAAPTAEEVREARLRRFAGM